MLATEREHPVIARMHDIPEGEVTGMQIVFVVLTQFLETGASDIDELDLHLGGGHAILATLYYILLAATCGLYHLIHSAVAVRR
jgi:type VI protein secretion system component VasA